MAKRATLPKEAELLCEAIDARRKVELRLLPDRFTSGPPVKTDAAKYRRSMLCKIGG